MAMQKCATQTTMMLLLVHLIAIVTASGLSCPSIKISAYQRVTDRLGDAYCEAYRYEGLGMADCGDVEGVPYINSIAEYLLITPSWIGDFLKNETPNPYLKFSEDEKVQEMQANPESTIKTESTIKYDSPRKSRMKLRETYLQKKFREFYANGNQREITIQDWYNRAVLMWADHDLGLAALISHGLRAITGMDETISFVDVQATKKTKLFEKVYQIARLKTWVTDYNHQCKIGAAFKEASIFEITSWGNAFVDNPADPITKFERHHYETGRGPLFLIFPYLDQLFCSLSKVGTFKLDRYKKQHEKERVWIGESEVLRFHGTYFFFDRYDGFAEAFERKLNHQKKTFTEASKANAEFAMKKLYRPYNKYEDVEVDYSEDSDETNPRWLSEPDRPPFRPQQKVGPEHEAKSTSKYLNESLEQMTESLFEDSAWDYVDMLEDGVGWLYGSEVIYDGVSDLFTIGGILALFAAVFIINRFIKK